jgi:hypothetical protein
MNVSLVSFLCFIRSLANHRIYGMHRTLQLIPDGLVDQLLSLYSSLSFKFGRNHFDCDMTPIGIIVRTRHLDIRSIQGILDLLDTNIHNGSIRGLCGQESSQRGKPRSRRSSKGFGSDGEHNDSQEEETNDNSHLGTVDVWSRIHKDDKQSE